MPAQLLEVCSRCSSEGSCWVQMFFLRFSKIYLDMSRIFKLIRNEFILWSMRFLGLSPIDTCGTTLGPLLFVDIYILEISIFCYNVARWNGFHAPKIHSQYFASMKSHYEMYTHIKGGYIKHYNLLYALSAQNYLAGEYPF